MDSKTEQTLTRLMRVPSRGDSTMTSTPGRCAQHPAFEADYCPSCGTTTPIGDRPTMAELLAGDPWGTTSVPALLRELTGLGLQPEWHMTGGGCYAVRVPVPAGEVLITDLEGPLHAYNLSSDDDRSGWLVVFYLLDAQGEPLDEGVEVLETIDPERGPVLAAVQQVARMEVQR